MYELYVTYTDTEKGQIFLEAELFYKGVRVRNVHVRTACETYTDIYL